MKSHIGGKWPTGTPGDFLKVLKVYRLRCFKKTEILRGGGDVWILYVHNSKTYMYKEEEEDSKKEKKTILNFILKSK